MFTTYQSTLYHDSDINLMIQALKNSVTEYLIKTVSLDLKTERATIESKKIKMDKVKPVYTVKTELPEGSKYKYHTDRFIELKAGRTNIKYRFTDCEYREDQRTVQMRFYNVSDEYGYELKLTAEKY